MIKIFTMIAATALISQGSEASQRFDRLQQLFATGQPVTEEFLGDYSVFHCTTAAKDDTTSQRNFTFRKVSPGTYMDYQSTNCTPGICWTAEQRHFALSADGQLLSTTDLVLRNYLYGDRILDKNQIVLRSSGTATLVGQSLTKDEGHLEKMIWCNRIPAKPIK